MLENDAAVQLISTSKIQINELLEKIGVSKVTEKQIDITRTAYKPLAAHATVIYFTIGKARVATHTQTHINTTYRHQAHQTVDCMTLTHFCLKQFVFIR